MEIATKAIAVFLGIHEIRLIDHPEPKIGVLERRKE
jgi:hypothetical protein